MKKMLFLVALGLCLVALLMWLAGGIQSVSTTAVEPIDYEPGATPAVATSTLTVVTWNVAWGFGWGSEGSQKPTGKKTKADIEASLQKIGEAIRDHGADIVLLQEVDFGSKRSFYLDEGELLARASGLRYFAPAVSWRANYIPFPYWPIAAHFGRMKSGGAILSRYPITSAEVQLLPKPPKNLFLYNWFYLFRFLQRAEILVGESRVEVFNMHLDAFHQDNRESQADLVAGRVRESRSNLVVVGGDLNTVPPESKLRHEYPDEPHTDHRTDATLARFRSLAGFQEAVTKENFAAGPDRFFTFPAHEPNRQLDHLFFSPGFVVHTATVPREVGDPSDHLPLVSKVSF